MKTIARLFAVVCLLTFLGEASHAQSQIQHVVIIMQQDKTFDHYFGTFPGADGATTATMSNGQAISLVHANDTIAEFCNSPYCYASSVDGGAMDRFDLVNHGNDNGNLAAYSQMLQADIPNYFTYAQQFVLADRMFSSQLAAGFPNQMLYIAATNGGAFDNPFTPPTIKPVIWGCDANPTITGKVWDAQGNISLKFPCFDFPTITDSIENSPAGLTWKFYNAPLGFGYEWNPLDAINHIRNNPTRWSNVVPDTQFVQDASKGNLATVSWVVPSSHNSEHAGHLPWGASVCDGENWTVEQINAVMQGPEWNSTAIIVTWDDSGGLFDHIPPPSIAPYQLGVRVPLLVISPYAKTAYVTHTQYSYYSTLKFIETIFNLPALTTLDGNAATMLDSFDFTQSPRAPVILQTRACPLISMENVSFGGELVGVSKAPTSVLVTNRRSTNLTVSNVTTTGNFTQTNTCTSALKPLASCLINVVFTPAAMGATSGQLTVTDNDASSPQVVNLTGTGTAIQLSSESLTYPSVGMGSISAPKIVTVTNKGTGSVSLGTIQTVGDFAQTNTCGPTLNAAASCAISITFNPMHPGQLYGAIFINDSDPATPQRVVLDGLGYQAGFKPGSVGFGTRKVGTTSPPKIITVSNLGTTTLTFASFVPTGDFAETNTCGTGIAPATTCQISVTFTPTATGTRAGTITVTDSDLRNPQVLSLSGVGQ